MGSDFDKLFAEAQSRHEAEHQAAEKERLEKERAARDESQVIRSLVESHLRDLGRQAARRLLDLKVPAQQQDREGQARSHLPKPLHDFFGGSTRKWYRSEQFWRLYSGYPDLLLTKGGYFIQDYKLPGPQGFEALLDRIRFREPNSHGYGLENGEIYVDARTQRLCIHVRRSLGGDMGSVDELHELGPWVADRILAFAD